MRVISNYLSEHYTVSIRDSYPFHTNSTACEGLLLLTGTEQIIYLFVYNTLNIAIVRDRPRWK